MVIDRLALAGVGPLDLGAVDEAGDVPVIAGLSAMFTEQAIEEAKRAEGAGARGLLVFPIPAYQGQPLDPGIPVAYHEAIARGCGLPMVAFQLQPALGGLNFEPDALRAMAAVEGVVAIKEASFDARRFVDTARLIADLPRPIRDLADRCVGLTTTVERLSRVRNERRPGSEYATADQCRYELRRAAQMYAAHRMPVIDSSAKSVEEMATMILQSMKLAQKERSRG